ncbi:MAG: flagellar biosynthesis protein FlhB [Pseudomonadota bacterium]|jgi:flagellar biosynthetic protein FlhB|nr:flagellar type III secretion system protein FlhB [Alphaproteobacteria bacterium]
MAEENQEQDKEQKTLDPSAKRYEDAYKKGQAPISRDLNNFIFLVACLGVCAWVLPWCLRRVLDFLSGFISMSGELQIDTISKLSFLLKNTFLKLIETLWIPFLSLMLAATAVGLGQSYKAISSKLIEPKMSHISIMQGIKRVFSLQSLVETIKSTIKIIFLGLLFYFIFEDHINKLTIWLWATPLEYLTTLNQLIIKYLAVVLIAYAFVSGFDFWYQHYTFKQNLKMTVQEQKEEFKEQEGDPKVRARIREIQRDRSRTRMLEKVPQATVIVTNPTHFSVALQWAEESMDAPLVVAKGADVLAFKIRDIAKEHKVPIVENAPVARSLYDSVNLDQQIPPEYYKVVAEIIRTAMRIRSHQF